MRYAMPRDLLTTANDVRRAPLVVHYPKPATARPAAKATASPQADAVRSVDPMLLVYQERAETFRLIAEGVTAGVKALARLLRA